MTSSSSAIGGCGGGSVGGLGGGDGGRRGGGRGGEGGGGDGGGGDGAGISMGDVGTAGGAAEDKEHVPNPLQFESNPGASKQ